MSLMLRNVTAGTLTRGFIGTSKVTSAILSQSYLPYCSAASEKVRLRAQTEMQEYWARNIKGPRPWSPHLLIYKMELPMLTSLLHRGSGIAMAIAWGGIGVSAFWYTGHYTEMIHWVGNLKLAAPILFGAKFIMCWPLIYHYTNGMRHLAYDAAVGFKISTTMTTGYIALAVSLVLASLAASITI